MPFPDSQNPLGAGNEGPRYGGAYMTFASTATTLPTIGTLLVLKTPYTPSPATGLDTNQTVVALLKAIKAPDAGSFKLAGVCVGGSTLGRAPVAGGTVIALLLGVATVRFGAATTAGDLIIVTTAHPGRGKAAGAATLGKTWGYILESVAITAGTKLVPCFLQAV